MFTGNLRMDEFRPKFSTQKQRKALRFHIWRVVKIPTKENTNMY